jgi:glutathione S-transferase
MGDYGSQPTRAVYVFCKMAKIDFTFKEVRVFKMEQYSPEFKKINPNGKVPAISDRREDGQVVNMFESHAILKYLCATRNVEDHWYPKDPR